ncbi:MAG: GAF domain-containing protein [Anaerolineae bacterium]|nr:GAF domain-containing protein [Anaerolineae bacterium]
MSSAISDFFALLNDMIQATIVIFGTSVVLYNSRYIGRSRVTKGFTNLVGLVVLAFLAELLASRAGLGPADWWLHLQWIGIALVPAAQFHLSDALLVTTGLRSRRRRAMVRIFYLTGLLVIGLIYLTDWIAAEVVSIPHAVHLQPGPYFPVFAFYFWVVAVLSMYNLWRARRRCLTSTARGRMTTILLAFFAAPLGVFPYLLIGINLELTTSWFFWLIVIAGNILVGTMFALMTLPMAYFGGLNSPDRVVRVRLYKFMARAPLAATIVLLVYLLVSRTNTILGLPAETSLALFMVATIIIVEWLIHTGKKPLERLLQLNDDADVQRIQELSERVLTTRDLHQFLESVLASVCEALRTDTAFVAALSEDGPHLEVVVGSLDDLETVWETEDWPALPTTPNGAEGGQPTELARDEGFILWQNFWIQPLYSENRQILLGIMGIRGRTSTPNLSPEEERILAQLTRQAAISLEDRLLQKEVFAAVEGLLPKITVLQRRRNAAAFDATPALTNPTDDLTQDPEFSTLVRDALSHYWGGPKLTQSPLTRLRVVQEAMETHEGNPAKALQSVLLQAIEQQKPEGQRSMTTAEWILYNILEMKIIQGRRVRDVARRLAMSESDLYRKQRVAIENVAQTVMLMEKSALDLVNGDES